MQVGSSEWVLGVQTQHFENMFNAETRFDQYCCCDTPSPCVESLAGLNPTTCNPECDPYFEMRFEVCFYNETCLIMKAETSFVDSVLATCISPLFGELHSEESTLNNISEVSAKSINKKY